MNLHTIKIIKLEVELCEAKCLSRQFNSSLSSGVIPGQQVVQIVQGSCYANVHILFRYQKAWLEGHCEGHSDTTKDNNYVQQKCVNDV